MPENILLLETKIQRVYNAGLGPEQEFEIIKLSAELQQLEKRKYELQSKLALGVTVAATWPWEKRLKEIEGLLS